MYKEEFLADVEAILQAYKESFNNKTYSKESDVSDILMESFGISSSLKKFKHYGHLLRSNGFRPVLLLLRDDSLTAAITACKSGGWDVLENKESFDYIFNNTGIDIIELLHYFENKFLIMR